MPLKKGELGKTELGVAAAIGVDDEASPFVGGACQIIEAQPAVGAQCQQPPLEVPAVGAWLQKIQRLPCRRRIPQNVRLQLSDAQYRLGRLGFAARRQVSVQTDRTLHISGEGAHLGLLQQGPVAVRRVSGVAGEQLVGTGGHGRLSGGLAAAGILKQGLQNHIIAVEGVAQSLEAELWVPCFQGAGRQQQGQRRGFGSPGVLNGCRQCLAIVDGPPPFHSTGHGIVPGHGGDTVFHQGPAMRLLA
jgi:hypothetical protein